MPNIIEITDFNAPELDVYARLTEAQLLSVLDEPELLRLQEALTRKRKLILYGGYVIFFLIYLFLYMVGWDIRFESRLTGTAVSCVGVFIWHFSSRALYSLVTGEPFFVPRPKKKWQHHVAVALFFLGIILLLLVLSFVEVKPLRDSLAIVGLMLAFISGCYVTVFEEELNK